MLSICFCIKIVFVLKPMNIITKYMTDMEYTDFTNGETRYDQYSTDKA